MVLACHIADEQIGLWHDEWKAEGMKQQDTLKRAFDQVGEELHRSNRFRCHEAEMYYRLLKEAGMLRAMVEARGGILIYLPT